MFRAKRKDGQGEVNGWILIDPVTQKAYITDGCHFGGHYSKFEVIPSTIAIKTGQLDNLEKYIANGCDILEIEEKKMVMDEWYDK